MPNKPKNESIYKQVKRRMLSFPTYEQSQDYIDRMYNAGIITVNEFARLDGILMDIIAENY